MLEAIKNFFENNINVTADAVAGDTDHRLRVATAALLIEVMRADFDDHDDERSAITSALREHFDLSAGEVDKLVELAEQEVAQSVDHYEFTSLIKNSFGREEKVRVIELMWQIAYADNHLQKYEDALVRKIADLIYVSHSDFMAAKHRVLSRQSDKD